MAETSLIGQPAEALKFVDPDITGSGDARASVPLTALRTLWFNTGTLCNLACEHCYIESTPHNDRLAYLERSDVRGYLDEIAALGLATGEIGLTGGEPFMNPHILGILRDCLEADFRALVLTNGMRPMTKLAAGLGALRDEFGDRLTLRVSVDHYRRALHEEERGHHAWTPMWRGLAWLARSGFRLHIAGRLRWDDEEAGMRDGFAAFFARHEIPVDAYDPAALVLFPEMDEHADVPEITTACWGILGKRPEEVMCSSSRMVIKRKGAAHPVVVSCTLLPYDGRFEMGRTLAESLSAVKLNHVHCAKFCVLGGASCSPGNAG